MVCDEWKQLTQRCGLDSSRRSFQRLLVSPTIPQSHWRRVHPESQQMLVRVLNERDVTDAYISGDTVVL